MATGNMHKKFVNFGRVIFELCEQRDKQTNGPNGQTHHSTVRPVGEVIINVVVFA